MSNDLDKRFKKWGEEQVQQASLDKILARIFDLIMSVSKNKLIEFQ